MADARLSDQAMEIVRFCAIECELQRSGERSVHWMVQAWMYAMGRSERGMPTESDILALGALVEPKVNQAGYRKVGVRVGWDVKLEWERVPKAMTGLIGEMVAPEMWFKEYEEIHPFRDGNGRTGVILYNWLRGSLDDPTWAPNFWRDDRRRPGEGAPRG